MQVPKFVEPAKETQPAQLVERVEESEMQDSPEFFAPSILVEEAKEQETRIHYPKVKKKMVVAID